MSMTDPIADLLTRIRNAVAAGHPSLDLPTSKTKARISNILKQEGYIQDFAVENTEAPRGRSRST